MSTNCSLEAVKRLLFVLRLKFSFVAVISDIVLRRRRRQQLREELQSISNRWLNVQVFMVCAEQTQKVDKSVDYCKLGVKFTWIVGMLNFA